MKIKKIHALYFSPTQTTRTIITHIAESIAAQYTNICLETHDFTLPSGRNNLLHIGCLELVIVGLPVYAGRLPNLLLNYLSSWKSDGALAVPIVVYGNRSYGNALIELRDILKNAGFHSIAAAAFIGQHSFSTKLATGRPDQEDLQLAGQFALEIVQRVNRLDGKTFFPVSVPGEGAPTYGGYYKPLGINGEPANFLKAKPVTSDNCIHCGHCAEICPMGAVDPENFALIPGICIKCNACIKACPIGAKQFTDIAYLSHVDFLENNYTSYQSIELY